jgi:hypothetical protein
MNQRDDTKAKEPRHSNWFVAIVALFVTCLITANIVAVKLWISWLFCLRQSSFSVELLTGDVLTGYMAIMSAAGDMVRHAAT